MLVIKSKAHWIFAPLALILVITSRATAATPTVTSALSNAPGIITIAYSHTSDGVRFFTLEQHVGDANQPVLQSAELVDTFTVLNLSPSTRYEFRVCAHYDAGTECTGYIAVITQAAQTPSTRQPMLPPIVSGVSTSGDSVTLHWIGSNGSYSSFLIRLEDQLGNSDQRKIDASDVGSFTFPRMRSGATYYLMMKGCRPVIFGLGGIHCSPWSVRREIRTASSLSPAQGQTVSLRNGGGLCLDVHAPDMRKNGGLVQAWECNGQDQQRWAFVEGSVRNVQGQCLDVDVPDMRTNGGRVQVWECNGTLQQQWKLSAGRLVGPYGRCLDVDFPNMRNNGAKVQIWDCNGSEQQRWQAVR